MIISVKKLIGCIAFVALHSVTPFTISDITSTGAAVRCCDVICGVVYLLAPFGRPAEGRDMSACTHACGIAWQIRSMVQNGVVHERVKLVRDDCLATIPGRLGPQRDCRAG